ncbi:MAG TPA: hypothetical protein VH309_11720 [Elusimicrobiota bacterium]|nr:hypothetical protein [Elusimicrobiota bacterium]
MNSVIDRPVPIVVREKPPQKMKLRYHVYPDARSTTRRGYCSAWSLRYGHSDRQ